MTESAVRTRLSPERRRNQILDSARQQILEKGLSSVTMESIATQASVSNPLIYKYFDSRMELLQALYQREYEQYYLSIRDQLELVADFRDAVRVFVEANFEQFARGNVLNILSGQPDVRAVVQRKETERAYEAQRFLVNGLMDTYSLSRPVAEHLVALGSSTSIRSAEHYNHRGGNRRETIERTIDFILAGVESIAKG